VGSWVSMCYAGYVPHGHANGAGLALLIWAAGCCQLCMRWLAIFARFLSTWTKNAGKHYTFSRYLQARSLYGKFEIPFGYTNMEVALPTLQISRCFHWFHS
jgi:hypothetical protein